jgi:Flp pilus assembly protein CpaB
MRRTVYLVLFLLLAGLAAVLTLRAQRTVSVLVAVHDLRAGAQVEAQDVEVRRMHEDSVPIGALAAPDDAVGQYVAWPLTAGEPVVSRMVRRQRSSIALVADVSVPDGCRAIAMPVQPAAAVGGMLSPGDHVDVYATPLPGHQSADTASPARTDGATTGPTTANADATVLLGENLLVLQLRTDQGQALQQGGDRSVHGLDFGSGKLGSVVLAVPSDQVARFAAAASSETIYLALSVG